MSLARAGNRVSLFHPPPSSPSRSTFWTLCAWVFQGNELQHVGVPSTCWLWLCGVTSKFIRCPRGCCAAGPVLLGFTSAGQGRNSYPVLTSRMAGKSHVSPQTESATVQRGVRRVECSVSQNRSDSPCTGKLFSLTVLVLLGLIVAVGWETALLDWAGELDLWINKTLMCPT